MPAYKNKERGTWYASFYYTDWQGTRKRKKREGFPTKREALDFERDFLNKSRGNCTMTFSSLIEHYMEDAESRLKPTTLATKRFIVEAKLLPTFGPMPLDTITPAMVRKWQNALICDSSNYSPTYLKTVHNQLTAAFNYAMKYYGLQANPARLCGSMGSKNANNMHFWTAGEFARFIAQFEDDPTSHLAFGLLFYTGIRSGELLALAFEDFDLEANTVRITKNFAQLKGQALILEPKTPKSKRTVTIPRFLADEVAQYVERLYDYESNQRLFTMGKSGLRRRLSQGAAAAGLRTIRVHDLRHSHASLLIEMGFPPLLISERLGHENIETTLQTYSHLYPNKHAEVAERLQEVAQNEAVKALNSA